MSTATIPGRAPSTDAELVRNLHDRIARLESARTVRVGPWVLGTDNATGNLIATRPGQTVLIDGEGATEIASQAINLSGLESKFVTPEQLELALEGVGGGGPIEDVLGIIQSKFADLYQMLTGSGVDPLQALAKLGDFLKIELGGPVDVSRLPLLPLAHIRDIITELLDDPDFSNPLTLIDLPDWDWLDTDGVDTPGVAQTIADGLTHTIFSNNIPVAEGDTLDVMAKAKWLGLTTSGANPLRVLVSFYNAAGAMIGGGPVLAAQGGAAGNSGGLGGWTTLTGQLPVPAGAKYAVQELTVTPAATGGTVRFGQASVSKSGLLPQGYVSGLLDAISGLWTGIQARLDDFMDLLDVFGGFGVGTGQGQLSDVAARISKLNPLTGTFDSAWLTNMAAITLPNGLSQVPQLGGLVDKATGALSGATQAGQAVVGATVTTAEQVMANLYNMLTANTRKVQALEAQNTASTVGGRQFNINFADYPDGPFPSGLFNLSYSGPGSSVLVISGGKAQWSMVNNGYRRATMQYPTPTLTSFQIVRGTMASPPSQGTNVRIWSVGRANAAMTEFVFARGYCTGFLSYKGDIGAYIGGVERVWASGISLTWSLDLRVVMGVGINARRHMVLSGDTIVWDGIEPAAFQSSLDSNHLYWGAISETDGSNAPGNVAGASVVDNAPPAVVGSTFRASRRIASDVTIAAGGAMLPANFYETVDYISPDITWSPSENAIYVSKQGTYLAQWRCFHGAFATGTSGAGLLWVKRQGGSWQRYALGPMDECPFNVGFGVMATPTNATFGTAIIALNPGDAIAAGFQFSNSMSNTGDAATLADGSQTWFAATRVGIA
ncbi:minor tail protein [Mycobacterium phage Quesadilla]|uniref:Minor tail protein n=1 Tax=Mycobacterium phage Quesadilla TaxID=2664226 RepID=A0A5Q2WF14_9CAUD|nr:minor tail protein [Mycobacterium phage Quesadilla]QGH75279.1 minor tail protein [Mycobacterium phage Quesadilla]